MSDAYNMEYGIGCLTYLGFSMSKHTFKGEEFVSVEDVREFYKFMDMRYRHLKREMEDYYVRKEPS